MIVICHFNTNSNFGYQNLYSGQHTMLFDHHISHHSPNMIVVLLLTAFWTCWFFYSQPVTSTQPLPITLPDIIINILNILKFVSRRKGSKENSFFSHKMRCKLFFSTRGQQQTIFFKMKWATNYFFQTFSHDPPLMKMTRPLRGCIDKKIAPFISYPSVNQVALHVLLHDLSLV